MKFVVRRAVIGLIAMPVVAGLYVFGFLSLEALSLPSGLSLEAIYNNGLLLGGVCAVFFAFANQVSKVIDRVIG